jgi:hypothetical protein
MGYTLVLAEAGRYSREEAEAIVADANYPPGVFHECLIPIAAVSPSLDLQKRAKEAELEVDLLRHERDYEEPYGQ